MTNKNVKADSCPSSDGMEPFRLFWLISLGLTKRKLEAIKIQANKQRA